jgi:hypothetical protein
MHTGVSHPVGGDATPHGSRSTPFRDKPVGVSWVALMSAPNAACATQVGPGPMWVGV